MSRRVAVVVAVVLAVAFGVAAGALPSASTDATSESEAPSPAPPADENSGVESSGVTELDDPVSGAAYGRLLAGLATVALAAAVVLVPGYRRALVGGAAVFAVAVASYAWLELGSEGVLATTVATAMTSATRPVGVAVGVALTAVVARFAWRYAGDEHDEAGPPNDAVADGAGNAPRASGVGPHPAAVEGSNDVSRAWQRAIRGVEVSTPAARTPGEFARAATRDGAGEAASAGDDAVADAEALEQLTDLFRRVRYGRADPDAVSTTATSLAADATDGSAEDATVERSQSEEADG